RVNCHVSLNKRQVITRITINRTDNPYRYGGIQSKRRTDSQDPLAFFQLFRVTNGQGCEVFGIYFDKRHIGTFVSTYHLGRVFLAIYKGDVNILCINDNMVIGQNVAIIRDDVTRAYTALYYLFFGLVMLLIWALLWY